MWVRERESFAPPCKSNLAFPPGRQGLERENTSAAETVGRRGRAGGRASALHCTFLYTALSAFVRRWRR